MEKDTFGSTMIEGKMINIDKEDINTLKKYSDELKQKVNLLNDKVENVFKQ